MTDKIPETGPWGITGPDYECGRCGDNVSGCPLCAGLVRNIIKSRTKFDGSS